MFKLAGGEGVIGTLRYKVYESKENINFEKLVTAYFGIGFLEVVCLFIASMGLFP